MRKALLIALMLIVTQSQAVQTAGEWFSIGRGVYARQISAGQQICVVTTTDVTF